MCNGWAWVNPADALSAMLPRAGKDSDDNPKKNVARAMISMVKDINSKMDTATGQAGKEYVTCYTCHRGKTEPETAAPPAGLPLP